MSNRGEVMHFRKWVGAIVSASIALAVAGSLCAQGFPGRPIRFIVPFPPAGPTDLAARLVAENMTETLHQPVLVENRAGANGIVGREALLKSPPDGYTVAIAVFPTLVVNPLIYSRLSYTSRDFTPVILLLRQSTVLVVGAQVPATTLSEVLALARSKEDGLFYGSYGAGSVPHIAMGMLQKQANLKLVHVPYAGNAAMNLAFLAGQVQLLFSTPDPILESVKAGKLKAIATAGQRRSSLLPNTPTFAEAGMSNFDVSTWSSIVAPAGVPPEIVGRLNAAMNAAVSAPGVRARFVQGGMEAAGGSPAEFAQFLAYENDRWGKLIKELGVKLD
jgi:tripartite-type tricarboxylate transporter receptor subunit TctC